MTEKRNISHSPSDATDMEDLRYPIGKYTPPETIDAAVIESWIEEIEQLPVLIRAAVEGLNDAQLDTPYRPEGWTVREVTHHVSDSHLNSIIRFKWTLTENEPTIKAYGQQSWVETPDVEGTPVEVTLQFLESLHSKWVYLLKSIAPADWDKAFIHPETQKRITLRWLLGLYAWHGKHHVAHIEALKKREGWG